jgi:hypothetical protein
MIRDLELDERYDWVRATLEHLASVPSLTDDDLGYVVFEGLDVDVRSCLHESNLDPLVTVHRLPVAAKQELLEIRSSCLSLIDRRQMWAEIRRDEQWLDLSRRSARVLREIFTNTSECDT